MAEVIEQPQNDAIGKHRGLVVSREIGLSLRALNSFLILEMSEGKKHPVLQR